MESTVKPSTDNWVGELVGRVFKEMTINPKESKVCFRTNNNTYIIQPIAQFRGSVNLVNILGDITNITNCNVVEAECYYTHPVFEGYTGLVFIVTTNTGEVKFNMNFKGEPTDKLPLDLLKIKRGA